MTAPEVNLNQIETFKNGGLIDASKDIFFSNQKTALALFKMEGMYSEKGFYQRDGISVWFAKEHHERFANEVSEDGNFIIERFDHRGEKNERTNRFAFMFSKDGYKFLGEYQVLVSFAEINEDATPLTVWKRINKTVRAFI